jgi:hypothetical protein
MNEMNKLICEEIIKKTTKREREREGVIKFN